MPKSTLQQSLFVGILCVAFQSPAKAADNGARVAPLPPTYAFSTAAFSTTEFSTAPFSTAPFSTAQVPQRTLSKARMPNPVRLPRTDTMRSAAYQSVDETPESATEYEVVTDTAFDGGEPRDRGSFVSRCGGHYAMWRARMQANWAETKAHLQASHWGYPEYFEERPFGTLVDAHITKQVVNAAAARMVLYRYDFHEGILGDATTLNPHGRRRLRTVARLAQCCEQCPVIIEPSDGHPEIDAARRQHVIEALAAMDCPVAGDRIVIRVPRSAGLRGVEALAIGEALVGQPRGPGGGSGSDISQGGGGTLMQTSPPNSGATR